MKKELVELKGIIVTAMGEREDAKRDELFADACVKLEKLQELYVRGKCETRTGKSKCWTATSDVA